MGVQTKFPKTLQELKDIINSKAPSLYISSQTSTVIPYDFIDKYYNDIQLVNLNSLPKKIEIDQNNNLKIQGPVSWQEARAFLSDKDFEIMVSPTEELASILAGLATSATGERSFHFGTLREQVIQIKYLDHQSNEHILTQKELNFPILKEYQEEYSRYKTLKNAPFPRLAKEIDLMIGTEGQLGVITEAIIKLAPKTSTQFLFMLLPKWENDPTDHFEVLQKVQNFRNDVIICELTDSNSFSYLKKEDQLNQNSDVIFFEVLEDSFETFYENFLMDLSFFDENKVFEISAKKFHQIRAAIPRAINEVNAHNKTQKYGTDIQTTVEDFKELIDLYRQFSKLGIAYNLFGHFGDAHLHFNFMAQADQVQEVQSQLSRLYQNVLKLDASPFAEHGIGLIKQKFITNFWSNTQYQVFNELKNTHDPNHVFFPKGYMTLKP